MLMCVAHEYILVEAIIGFHYGLELITDCFLSMFPVSVQSLLAFGYAGIKQKVHATCIFFGCTDLRRERPLKAEQRVPASVHVIGSRGVRQVQIYGQLHLPMPIPR